MKIFLALCCVTLATLFHPAVFKNQSRSPFRVINIPRGDSGYTYFDSLAITTSQDFKTFLEEISQQQHWYDRQAFVDALLNAKIDFNQEALVLLRHDEGSISARVTFETPVVQDKTLLCEIRGDQQGAGLMVVAIYGFAFAVSKSLVDKVQLKAWSGSGNYPLPTILLSTTERQPLNMRRDPAPPPKPSPSECPKLIIECPTDLLETGKTYVVKALVEGGDLKPDVTYNWSMSSGGEIVGGQGTPGLVVRIKEPDKIFEAWLSLGNINPHCDAVASCKAGPTR